MTELEHIIPSRDFHWAWDNYKETILKIADEYECRSFLEIGGGRFPLLSSEEIQERGIKYTVNDISQSELDRVSDDLGTACFDISGDISPQEENKYDMMFSKMVFEHIKDVEKAYKNIYFLLEEGGVCINFHPTLFSPPFVVNYLMPDALSSRLLKLFDKDRNVDKHPKFPAYYDCCFSTKATQEKIKKIGFKDVTIAPFYGQDYFKKIPVLRSIDNVISDMAMKKNYRYLSSFAYTIVRK